MIKDIPFVTNISKDYDKDILDSNYNGLSCSKGTYPTNDNKNNTHYNKVIDKTNSNITGNPDNQFYFNDLKHSHITDTINSLNGFEIRQDKLSKVLLAQLNYDRDNTPS